MKSKNAQNKLALLLTGCLLLVILTSLAAIFLSHRTHGNYLAEIYQDGQLIASIPLQDVDSVRTFTVTGDGGCQNEVELRPGTRAGEASIGIISADCPDKLCVGQGFISNDRLPITCLPNRLVILLRPDDSRNAQGTAPDIISY